MSVPDILNMSIFHLLTKASRSRVYIYSGGSARKLKKISCFLDFFKIRLDGISAALDS